MSAYPANYYVADDPGQFPDPHIYTTYASDSIDNNGDGNVNETGEAITHLGWFFDFPNTHADFMGERVIVDPLIREGRAIVLSFSPKDSECSGSGYSMIHEMNAARGGNLTGGNMSVGNPSEGIFDTNGDNKIDADDLIDHDSDPSTDPIPPTGIAYLGLLQPPKILRIEEPGEPDREVKLFNNETATMTPLFEKAEKRGIFYWIEK